MASTKSVEAKFAPLYTVYICSLHLKHYKVQAIHSSISFVKKFNSHSFIMPMSMQRLRRQAWQWRRLSFVMVQLPLKGQVKEALRFMLRLLEHIQN